MQVKLKLDGRTASNGSALIMHNERLADPLDTFTRAIAEVTSKRKKALADHEEIGRLEFYGGLYTDPHLDYPLNGTKAAPVVPAWNILRCLQDGGKRYKRGVDVPRGIMPLAEVAKIQYDGPKDVVKLWEDGSFALRKSVGVQRNRTMRTRPFFTDWQAELPIEVDMEIFNLSDLEMIWKAAGLYSGLGDMRPVYGRFTATIEKV